MQRILFISALLLPAVLSYGYDDAASPTSSSHQLHPQEQLDVDQLEDLVKITTPATSSAGLQEQSLLERLRQQIKELEQSSTAAAPAVTRGEAVESRSHGAQRPHTPGGAAASPRKPASTTGAPALNRGKTVEGRSHGAQRPHAQGGASASVQKPASTTAAPGLNREEAVHGRSIGAQRQHTFSGAEASQDRVPQEVPAVRATGDGLIGSPKSTEPQEESAEGLLLDSDLETEDGAVETPSSSVRRVIPVVGQLFKDQLRRLGEKAGSPPEYEDHTITSVVTITPTVRETVTKTHTLRIPSTSDVWVTSLKIVTMPVTQLTTARSFGPSSLVDTVTSFLRITKTEVVPVTRTVEVYPTKTLLSVYTSFMTSVTVVDLWQPIVHYSTQYEYVTRQLVETQILMQRLFTTTTSTSYTTATTTRFIDRFF